MTRRLFLFAGTLALLAGALPASPAPKTAFSAAVSRDAASGWHIVQLAAENRLDPRKSIAVRICPEGGNNLYSFSVGGTELLFQPVTLNHLLERRTGIPILYPTPNRVRDSVYVFMGETHRMAFPGEAISHWIHGLAADDTAWEFDPPEAGAKSAVFRARYALDPGHPRFTAYPYASTLTVEYTLLADRVRVRYTVENRDTRPLGFGFALHPFWQVIGPKETVRIRVPLPWHMEAEKMLPTGKLDRITPESPWSLLDFKPISALRLDDVYFGATPKSKVDVRYESIGLELRQRASKDFTHVVVFTPDRDYFCIENQTCSTDAHNLHARGLVRESHLQVLRPGKTTGGQVEFIPVWTRK